MRKWLEILGLVKRTDGDAERVKATEDVPLRRTKMWVWLGFLFVVGLLMMWFSTAKEEQTVAYEPQQAARASPVDHVSNDLVRRYEQAYEQALERSLQSVIGVGQVQTFVNIDSIEEVLVEKNRTDTQQMTNEQDQKGATRQITEMERDGKVAYHNENGEQQPIILKKIKPRIRGVLVVAEGTEQPLVKNMVIEAVARTLDVPTHRISVLPRKKS